MATGEVLHGGSGIPLFGKNGTILFAQPASMSVDIVISWTGGKDVDICGLYAHGGDAVGFDHVNGGTVTTPDGFTATHGGDNTTGGPETVHLEYHGNRSSLADIHFDVHANWYSVGTDGEGNEQSGGGPATITATDAKGTTMSMTLMPGTSKHRAANTGDPGARINFNMNGTLKSITSC